MKKFIVIFLVFAILLAACNIVSAEDYYAKINLKLEEIKANIEIKDIDNAKINLEMLREYVYELARELAESNRYNDEILKVISFAAQAIEENNLEYIIEAHKILDSFYKNPIIEINNHS
jgi:uncharacterized OsmC-like protein